MSYKFKADLGWIQFDVESADAESFQTAVRTAKDCALSARSLDSAMRGAVKGLFEDPGCWDTLLDILVEEMTEEGFVRHMGDDPPAHLLGRPVGIEPETVATKPEAPLVAEVTGQEVLDTLTRMTEAIPAATGEGRQPYGPRDKSVDWGAVKADVEAGMPLRDAAAKHGSDHSTVGRWAQKQGWVVPEDKPKKEREPVDCTAKWSEDQWAQVRKAWESGKSQQQAGDLFGMPQPTVSKRCRTEGWVRDDPVPVVELPQIVATNAPGGPELSLVQPEVVRRLALTWEAAFRAAVLMAEGKDDRTVADKLSAEFYKWGGSPPDERDMERLRAELAADIKALETAMVMSPGELSATKPVVQARLKEQSGVRVEYTRPRR